MAISITISIWVQNKDPSRVVMIESEDLNITSIPGIINGCMIRSHDRRISIIQDNREKHLFNKTAQKIKMANEGIKGVKTTTHQMNHR